MKSEKLLTIILFILVLSSISIAFYKYIIKQNYIIESESTCDPATQVCFERNCDTDLGSNACNDGSYNLKYFNLIKRSASDVGNCDDTDTLCASACTLENGCTLLTCDKGGPLPDTQCSIIPKIL